MYVYVCEEMPSTNHYEFHARIWSSKWYYVYLYHLIISPKDIVQ